MRGALQTAGFLLISYLVAASSARAEKVITYDQRGVCDSLYAAYTVVSKESKTTVSYVTPQTTDANGVTYYYNAPYVALTVTHYYDPVPGTGGTRFGCIDGFSYYLTIDPPPPKGIWQTIYNQAIRVIYSRSPKQTYHGTPTGTRTVPTGNDGGGVRGSVTFGSGWVATTASPAWLQFGIDPAGGSRYMFFIVDQAGPGASVTVYGDEGALWSQPLSNFVVGDLNIIDLGASAVQDPSTETLTIMVSPPTSGTAQLYFPDQSTQVADAGSTDAPMPVWCVAALATGLIGIARRRFSQSA